MAKTTSASVARSLPPWITSGHGVATGGGAVLKASNRRNLRRNGIIVLLTAPPEEILRRIAGKPGRPLMSGTSPAETMRALLQKREPYYRDCDLIVSTAAKTPSRVAAEIVARLFSL